MNLFDVVGYSFEASIHCPDCTIRRFGGDIDEATDREGNAVHPIFRSDCESDAEHCDDCGDDILEDW